MAISPEQKAINKVAVSLRAKAHTARAKALTKELEDAQAALKASSVYGEYKQQHEQYEELEAKRKAELSLIDQQLSELNARKKEVDTKWTEILLSHRATVRQLSNEYFKAKSTVEAAVQARYPDLADGARFSAAIWKPLDEFVDQAKATKGLND